MTDLAATFAPVTDAFARLEGDAPKVARWAVEMVTPHRALVLPVFRFLLASFGRGTGDAGQRPVTSGNDVSIVLETLRLHGDGSHSMAEREAILDAMERTVDVVTPHLGSPEAVDEMLKAVTAGLEAADGVRARGDMSEKPGMTTDSPWVEAQATPFRASVDRAPSWGDDRPSYTLAVALKRSGDRILLAFDLAETRDLFVEGNLDNEVQVEPDGAEQASAWRPSDQPPAPPADTLDQAFSTYRLSEHRMVLARQGMEDAFIPDVRILAMRGDVAQAAGLVMLIPSGSPENHLARLVFPHVGVSFEDVAPRDPPRPTRKQAVALLAWQRAWLAKKAAHEVMSTMVKPLYQDCLNRRDFRGMAELIDRIPPSTIRALLQAGLKRHAPKPPPPVL